MVTKYDFTEYLRKLEEQNRLTIRYTPAPGCIACEYKRLHTPEEKARYHPLSGHGTTDGKRWSYERPIEGEIVY